MSHSHSHKVLMKSCVSGIATEIGALHLCHRRDIPFLLQKGGETKLELRGKGHVQETSISPRCDAILHLDHM